MKKRFLAIAASAVLTLASATSSFAYGWQQSGGRWWYGTDAGNTSYYSSGWQQIDGSWYYFDGAGWMAQNKWVGDYYVGPSGVMLTNTQTPDGYYVGADGRWVSGASSGSLAGQTVSYTLIGHEVNGMPADIIDCDVDQNISIRYLSDSDLEMDWNGYTKNLKKSWGSCWHGAGEDWIEFKGDKLYVTGSTDPEEYFIYAESGSAASQQGVKEDKWTGDYLINNGRPIWDWDKAQGVHYVFADNNTVHIKGYFVKDGKYIGYHEKMLTFSSDCTFEAREGNEPVPYSKEEYFQLLNRRNGIAYSFYVKNDVIYKAMVSS